MLKVNVFLTRKSGTTLEQFSAYWKEIHGPLLMQQPEVIENTRRYIQLHSTDNGLPGVPVAPYDGIAEIWVDDLDGVAAIFTSDNYQNIIAPDEANFLDREKTVIMYGTEIVVVE